MLSVPGRPRGVLLLGYILIPDHREHGRPPRQGTLAWGIFHDPPSTGLNSVLKKFMSTCDLQMGPYLEIRSLQM